jgi:hypothetical protein
MESHYHDRAILESWLATEKATNKEELKKILIDKARKEFLGKSSDWSQRVKKCHKYSQENSITVLRSLLKNEVILRSLRF